MVAPPPGRKSKLRCLEWWSSGTSARGTSTRWSASSGAFRRLAVPKGHQLQVPEEGQQIVAGSSQLLLLSIAAAGDWSGAFDQLQVEVRKEDVVSVDLRIGVHSRGQTGKGALHGGHRLRGELKAVYVGVVPVKRLAKSGQRCSDVQSKVEQLDEGNGKSFRAKLQNGNAVEIDRDAIICDNCSRKSGRLVLLFLLRKVVAIDAV
ncbi:hypothetical protein TYRP_006383 [Tyrophagus putrescentiae]|nr:hypothetical protein TYRP_006383 [Tyrophagus putrescentiae]